MNPLQKVIDFLEKLREANLLFRLDSVREAVMVEVMVPGEHWEVEFFPDGHVEIEVYSSGGAEEGFEDESALERLFAENAAE